MSLDFLSECTPKVIQVVIQSGAQTNIGIGISMKISNIPLGGRIEGKLLIDGIA